MTVIHETTITRTYEVVANNKESALEAVKALQSGKDPNLLTVDLTLMTSSETYRVPPPQILGSRLGNALENSAAAAAQAIQAGAAKNILSAGAFKI